MTRYLTLINFTDQGFREIKNPQQRAARFSKSIEAAGGRVLGLYWAVGDIDGAVLFEAPDDVVVSALLVKLGKEGCVRTKSTRLLDEAEFTRTVTNI